MQTSPTAANSQAKTSAHEAGKGKPQGKYKKIGQPLDVINVPGALLRMETLATLSGVSTNTLYRAAKVGHLVLTKHGLRCTRVTSENARAYLSRVTGGSV